MRQEEYVVFSVFVRVCVSVCLVCVCVCLSSCVCASTCVRYGASCPLAADLSLTAAGLPVLLSADLGSPDGLFMLRADDLHIKALLWLLHVNLTEVSSGEWPQVHHLREDLRPARRPHVDTGLQLERAHGAGFADPHPIRLLHLVDVLDMNRVFGHQVGVESQGSGAGAEEQQLTVDFGRKQIPQVIHQP